MRRRTGLVIAVVPIKDRKVEFVWSDKPAMYEVRDQLQMRTCDVIMGLDSGDARVATTKPYYRAPYVFIQRRDTNLDITRWDSPDVLKAKNIGFMPGTPAQTMLDVLNRASQILIGVGKVGDLFGGRGLTRSVFASRWTDALDEVRGMFNKVPRGLIFAGLDVFDPEPVPPNSEILQLPNVFISPHIGWYSGDAHPHFFELMVD